MAKEIKENILSGSAWLRILLMLIYAVFAWVVGFVIVFLIIVQAICNLLFGENNQQVKEVSSAAVDYFSEILAFMSYCSDNKPAPFSSFNAEGESENVTDEETHIEVRPEESVTEVAENAENNPEELAKNTNKLGNDSDFDDDVFADISFTTQDQNQDEPDEDESDDNKKAQDSS